MHVYRGPYRALAPSPTCTVSPVISECPARPQHPTISFSPCLPQWQQHRTMPIDPLTPGITPPWNPTGSSDLDEAHKAKSHVLQGSSAAGARALGTQLVAFYFRAPVKAFFRMRVDYMVLYPPSLHQASRPKPSRHRDSLLTLAVIHSKSRAP
jgi:hypothetical protein